jgi:hypothetical protein
MLEVPCREHEAVPRVAHVARGGLHRWCPDWQGRPPRLAEGHGRARRRDREL